MSGWGIGQVDFDSDDDSVDAVETPLDDLDFDWTPRDGDLAEQGAPEPEDDDARQPVSDVVAGANLVRHSSFESDRQWSVGPGWQVPFPWESAYHGSRVARIETYGPPSELVSNLIPVDVSRPMWASAWGWVLTVGVGFGRVLLREFDASGAVLAETVVGDYETQTTGWVKVSRQFVARRQDASKQTEWDVRTTGCRLVLIAAGVIDWRVDAVQVAVGDSESVYAPAPNEDLLGENIDPGTLPKEALEPGLSVIEVVDTLPTPDAFRVAMLTSDGRLYSAVDDAWRDVVSASELTGLLTSDQIADDAVLAQHIADNAVVAPAIADGALELAKFYNGLRPIQVVAALPGLPHVDYPVGSVVLLTSDQRLYRSTGSAWTSAVPASDLTGQLAAGQLGITDFQNLAWNPGFESDHASWFAGNATIETTTKRTGLKSSKWVYAGGSVYQNNIWANPYSATWGAGEAAIPCVEGQKFYGEVWGRISNASANGGIYARFEFYNASGSPVSQSNGTYMNSLDNTQWKKASQVVAAPAGAAFVRFRPLADANQGPAVTFYLDDALFFRQGTRDLLEDGALELAKFANGLRPIQVLAALPSLPNASYPIGAVVLLTTDQKLYRSATGNVWERRIHGEDDIEASTITGDRIVAGTITAGLIGAGQITTEKLTVGSVGDNTVINSGFEDLQESDNTKPAGWALDGNSTAGGGWGVSTSSPAAGARSATLTVASGTDIAAIITSSLLDIPVVAGEFWYISAAMKGSTAAGGGARIYAHFYDSAGGAYSGSFETWGWDTAWTKRERTVQVPDGKTRMRIGIWAVGSQMTGPAPTFPFTGYVDDVTAKKVTVTAMIADNAITTPKILAGAIETSHMDTGTINASVLSAGSILAGHIGAGQITTEKLTVGSVGDNAILNGGFEDLKYSDATKPARMEMGGLTSWATETTEVLTGARSVKTTVSGSGVSGWVSVEAGVGYIPVVAGEQWYGSVYAKAGQAAAGGLFLRAWFYDKGEVALSAPDDYEDFITGNRPFAVTWTKYEGIVTVPAGAAFMRVGFYHHGPGLGAVTYPHAVYWDDLTARKVIVSASIADGAIVANKIAAGAVLADKVAAGAITTEKLTVGGMSDNAVRNGSFEDLQYADATKPASWQEATNATAGGDWGLSTAAPGAGARNLTLLVPTSSDVAAVETTAGSLIPVVPGEKWYVAGLFKGSTAATGTGRKLYVHWFNAALGYVSSNSEEGSWELAWTRAEEVFTVPAGIAFMRVAVWASGLTMTGSPTYPFTGYVDDVVARKVVTSAVIADGAVIAQKVAAGSITTEKLTVGSVGDNAILNGSFEDAQQADATKPALFEASDAVGSYTWALETALANVRTGSRSLKTVVTGTGDRVAPRNLFSHAIPVVPGERWYIGVWHKASTAHTTGLYLRAWFFRADGSLATSQYGSGSQDVVTNGPLVASWTLREGTVTVPSDAAKMLVGFYHYGTGMAGATFPHTVYWDDLVARKMVVSAVIADGAITTPKLVAGSITADKLMVGGSRGAALNADPMTADASAWVTQSGTNWEVANVTDGKVGRTVLRSTGGAGSAWVYERHTADIDPTKVYRLRAWVRRKTGDRLVFLLARFTDGSGTVVTSPSTGWAVGTHLYWGLAEATVATLPADSVWREYVHTFGAQGAVIPTNAKAVQVGAILNYTGGTTDGIVEVQDLRVEEVLPGTLIQDGAITASKIVAGSITASKLVVTDQNNQFPDASLLDPAFLAAPAVLDPAGYGLWSALSTGVWRLGTASTTYHGTISTRVEPGSQIRLVAQARADAGVVTVYYTIYSDAAMTNVVTAQTSIGTGANGSLGTLSANVTVPYQGRYLKWTFITDASTPANTFIAGLGVFRRMAGELIVDGAITAAKVAAGAIDVTKLTVTDLTNLAENADFEYGDVSWAKGSTWAITNSGARTGSWCASKTGGVSAALRNSFIVPVEVGDDFRAEAWLKTGTGGWAYVRICLLNASKVEITTVAGNTVAAGTSTWTLSAVNYTIPSGTYFIRVEVVSDNTGGTAYADDVRLLRRVNGSLIVDGSITTAKIAAGQVTADRLLVSGGHGAALNADPMTSDATAWTTLDGSNWEIATVTDGKVGNTVLRSTGAAGNAWMYETRKVDIDPTKVYRLHAWVRRKTPSDRMVYLAARFCDSAGAVVTAGSNGWLSVGLMQYWGLASADTTVLPADSVWREYVHTFGAQGAVIPTNAKAVQVGAILNYTGGTTDGIVEVQDLRVEEVLPGTLIQDGAITASKIVAGGITADRLAVGLTGAVNLLRNGGFRAGLTGWYTWTPASWTFDMWKDSASWTLRDGDIDNWTPAGTNYGSSAVMQTTVNSGVGVIYQDVTAAPGEVFSLSVLMANHRCTEVYARIEWCDSAGSWLSVTAPVYCTQAYIGGANRSGWFYGAIDGAVAPAGTSYARVVLIGAAPWTSGASAVALFDQAMLTSTGKAVPYARFNGTQIADGTISTPQIATGAVTADKISVANLSAISANLGSIVVDTANIANLAVTTLKIGDQQVTFSKIADGAVSGIKIGDGGVLPTKFDTLAPKAPTGLAVTSSVVMAPDGTSVVVVRASWTLPTQNTDNSALVDLDGTVVEATSAFTGTAESPTPDWTYPQVLSVAKEQNYVTFDGVGGSRRWWVRARCIDIQGNRSPVTSVVEHTTVGDATAPDAPTALVAVAGNRGVGLRWNPTSASDLSHYEVQQAITTTAPGGVPDVPTDGTITLATSAAADDIIDTATAHGQDVGDVVYFPTMTGGAGLSGAITLATSAAADDIIDTAAAHDITPGEAVVFPTLTGGAGLVAGQVYYVVDANLGAQTLKVSATPGGTPVNFTTDITAGTIRPLRPYYVLAANLGAQTLKVSATPGGAAVNFTTDITAGTMRKSLSAWSDVMATKSSAVWVPGLQPFGGPPATTSFYWFRVRSVDLSGNASPWTTTDESSRASVSAQPLLVGQADIAANSITAAHIHASGITADVLTSGLLQVSTGVADRIDGIGVTQTGGGGTKEVGHWDENGLVVRDYTTQSDYLKLTSGKVELYTGGNLVTAITPTGIDAGAIRFGQLPGGHNVVPNSSFEVAAYTSQTTLPNSGYTTVQQPNATISTGVITMTAVN